MMVTFISQCDKKALKKTRRVLDAFANRIGDNTWQTIITEDGLETVKKLLRQTASKSTAVSCHWIRSRSRSELVWIVGNRNKFNAHGIVPVNRTTKNIRRAELESHWPFGTCIQITAVIAALLHDIGKATIGFQDKLKNKSKKSDPYRHEWISFRLFQALIVGCETDKAWLERFANMNQFLKENPNWLDNLKNDYQGGSAENIAPPFARLISWLIVTHHRLPFYDRKYRELVCRNNMKDNDDFYLKISLNEFFEDLSPINGWVKNEKNLKERTPQENQNFWRLKDNVMKSKAWQKYMARWAQKALNHLPLWQDKELSENSSLSLNDPFVLYMSRLCLMVGDHNYSSKPGSDNLGDQDLKEKLAANTYKGTGKIKQVLDDHLIGVAKNTAYFSNLLPALAENLPAICGRSNFSKATKDKHFIWQNKSIDLAKKISEATKNQGFFGINMASTGCGKTLGNAKILYALSGDEGARFTIALGLRVLTLQTGQALGKNLSLDASDLAVLVGGTANRTLFELNQEEEQVQEAEETGSESSASLLKEKIVDFDEGMINENELGIIVADNTAKKLLYAPVVSCTIDHLMSASESIRGGRHIVPILRLLTSDLILDEPDDFSQEDLPALARLVHLAGLFGSRVLLSSATLTPDLVSGLFQSYEAGRKIWHKHAGLPPSKVMCAWFDEFEQANLACENAAVFEEQHQRFVAKRIKHLQKMPVRRRADILPIDLPKPREGKEIDYPTLAKLILQGAVNLHKNHHEVCDKTKKKASIGLVRFANTSPLVRLIKSIYESNKHFSNTQFHVCCYHAKQLLILRSDLEKKLDRILNRKKYKTESIFEHAEIKQAINKSAAKNHIFIVFATPVAEVGRDHDYDWAILEPSSMRSIIQLAGRIWRHRYDKITEHPNVMIMSKNIRTLKQEAPAFIRPGFESTHFSLESHHVNELLRAVELESIDALPRIAKSETYQPTKKLSDLEHAVMEDLLNNKNGNFVNAFWHEAYAHRATAHLQLISPFRYRKERQEDYVCIPGKTEWGFSFKAAEPAWEDAESADSINYKLQYENVLIQNPCVTEWLGVDLDHSLQKLAEKLDERNLTQVALRYATVTLPDWDRDWYFHPSLGFWN